MRGGAVATLDTRSEVVARGMLRALWQQGSAPLPAGALASFVRRMSLWRSPSIQQWVAAQDKRLFRPWGRDPETGGIRFPRLSRRRQMKRIKQAIFQGEIRLEPTVMCELPRFKGHMHQRKAPERIAEIEAKMADMPRMVEEYRQERREARAKLRAEKRWK